MGDRETADSQPTASRPAPLFIATCAIAGVLLIYFVIQIGSIGLDVRDDYWAYWRTSRYNGDIATAMFMANQVLNHARQIAQQNAQDTGKPPVDIFAPGAGFLDPPWNAKTILERYRAQRPALGILLRAWVINYDDIQQSRPEGDYDLDYPPMRLLTMTLWVWHVRSQYPNLNRFPQQPIHSYDARLGRDVMVTEEISRPLIDFNTICSAVAALAMMMLVWVWVNRCKPKPSIGWRSRWGDPLLLLPAVLLGLLLLIRPFVDWQLDFTNGIRLTMMDERVLSAPFWIFWTLRVMAAAGAARFLPQPFRGPACGAVAATLFWLNPALLIDSHGWPQWDVWPLPFYLLAALLVSVDWWILAGVLVGVGCMFKGQILFAAPVLAIFPLFAGWPVRSLRFIAGAAATAGLCVWPWIMVDATAQHYLFATLAAAIIIIAISFLRSWIWNARLAVKKHWRLSVLLWIGIACVIAGAAGMALTQPRPAGYLSFLLVAGVLILPWALPRRWLTPWAVLVFAIAMWLAAFNMNGKFSWWTVGFEYGTQKHTEMQVGGDHLNNLAALMEDYWHWQTHDPFGQLHLPFRTDPIQLDLQAGLATIFGVILILCSIGAAIHFKRGDERFIIAIVAPWIIFPYLLTQMSARYVCWPAAMGAALAGVSLRLCLLDLALTIVGCVTFLDRLWPVRPRIGPLTFDIEHPIHPDMGWAALAIIGIVLWWAVAPRWRRESA